MNKLKETNGKYYQKCEVVMLDTNDKTAPILSYLNDKSLQYFPNTYWSNGDLSKRHLYFLSNEEIKEGDWCINSYDNRTWKYEPSPCPLPYWGNKDTLTKIIATTNTSLRLPQPSKEFIQAFITAYNEYEPITKVLVEMEGIESSREFTPITYQLKLNSSNEITIKKIKDSWTRKEMFDCWLYSKGLVLREETDQIKRERIQFNKWIEQNL